MNANPNLVPDLFNTTLPLMDGLSVASDPIQQRLQNRRHRIHGSSQTPVRFYCRRFPLFGAVALQDADSESPEPPLQDRTPINRLRQHAASEAE